MAVPAVIDGGEDSGLVTSAGNADMSQSQKRKVLAMQSRILLLFVIWVFGCSAEAFAQDISESTPTAGLSRSRIGAVSSSSPLASTRNT